MNTNPRAIKVVNEQLRPNADRFLGVAIEAQGMAALATIHDTASLFPADSELVADGASEDGRPTVTNADALAAMSALGEFVAFLSTPSKVTGKTPVQAFGKFAVNPR